MSIGYDVLQESYDDTGTRHLIECRLWECSIVNFPMNEAAQVFSVKGRNATAHLAPAARFIKSVLAADDDEARSRIKDIAEHCKMLLGDVEDDQLIEGEDAETEDDPKGMEKALVAIRTSVARVSDPRA